MSTKKLSPSQLKKFRSDVAKLKGKGLVGKRIDARSQKPTRYMQSQVKKYGDVLEGKAKVIHVPRVKDAKPFKERYRTKGKSIVVTAKPDEKLAYSKKTGTISATRKTASGKKITREIYAEPPSKAVPPSGKGSVHYVIPLSGGSQRQSFDTWEDLVLFMEPYEVKERNPYLEWEQYVEVVRVSDGDA